MSSPQPKLEAACAAINSGKAGQRDRLVFLQGIEGLAVTSFDAVLRKSVLELLKVDTVEHYKVFSFWRSLFKFDPLFAPLLNRRDEFSVSDIETIRQVLCDDFLCEGLRKLKIVDQELEKLLTALRRFFLLDLYPTGVVKTKDLNFLCALAEQCFGNEYVFSLDDEERKAVALLPQDDAVAVSLRACYEPVFVNSKLSAVTSFRRMVDFIVRNRAREEEIKRELPTISAIQDDVSKSVRAMYEENPYPRWRSADMPIKPKTGTGGKWLVAGCGTGWPLTQAAKAFPEIDFTAIDISKSSLAYAARMSEQYDLENISFAQCDILDLSKLEGTFDFIECSGVLHHMKDPVAGWKKLIEKLNPGGRMLICLYSTKARRVIEAVRQYIKEKGYPPTPDGIRALRQDMFALPEDHPLKPITRRRDFYSMSEARDLMFHIQEKTYDVAEIKEMLENLGLSFLGFKMNDPKVATAYAGRFPEDPFMTNLSNWDKMEDEFPDLFYTMYRIVCGRKGEPDITPMCRFISDSHFIKL